LFLNHEDEPLMSCRLYLSIVLSPIVLKNCLKIIQGPRRKNKICPRHSNLFCLFIEIQWSVAEALLMKIFHSNFEDMLTPRTINFCQNI
jgi:hypothetical protein